MKFIAKFFHSLTSGCLLIIETDAYYYVVMEFILI